MVKKNNMSASPVFWGHWEKRVEWRGREGGGREGGGDGKLKKGEGPRVDEKGLNS